ncbi:MAG TPA: PAS domain-containing protein, partial [Methanoculleus sp.]|nr:PAS domain-containing protein [Methanoculleus sp.]
ALALSRVQLSHAMDLAHLVNWEFDMSNGIFTFNDQFYALYGTTAEREGGYQMPAEVYAREFVYPPDQHLVDEEVKRAIETTDPDFISRIEHRIVRRDGEIRTIVVRFSITKDADGRTIRTHGANEDISDIVRMQQALQVSEERQRLALDGAGAGFWDWDLKTGNAVFSSAIYSMLGYEPGDFPANYEAYFSLIHPNEREQVISEIKKQIDENLPNCEIEYRCRAADGNWIWISSKGKIVGYDNEGKPSRMTGVNIDITNWRLLESEIRSLNAVLEQRVKDRTEALQQTNAALELENAQRIEAETKLQASYNEKVTLLKEIHHRVKNNLQIIASLLNLQSRYIHDDATLATIRESQNRVRAMALVHEKLYKADDISHISLGDYVSFLGAGLFQFYDAK